MTSLFIKESEGYSRIMYLYASFTRAFTSFSTTSVMLQYKYTSYKRGSIVFGLDSKKSPDFLNSNPSVVELHTTPFLVSTLCTNSLSISHLALRKKTSLSNTIFICGCSVTQKVSEVVAGIGSTSKDQCLVAGETILLYSEYGNLYTCAGTVANTMNTTANVMTISKTQNKSFFFILFFVQH